MSAWREVTFGEVCELKRGYDLPKSSRVDGTVPVVSSSGITGLHSYAKVRAPGVVTGRYGTLGNVFYLEEDFWPLNTALYVRDFKGNDPRFVAALLESMDLQRHDAAAAVPGLNRNHVHQLIVRVPDARGQVVIAGVLRTFDDMIRNNQRRAALLEQAASAIFQEWFVRLRYPGYEDDSLVVGPIGPIPEGWALKRVAELATPRRTGVTGGPFGSKLGRKDYVDLGVPVIRGANLSVGGGFDENDVVFVSNRKAEELRASWAKRGDVLITQRGTLGQVGLIPMKSRFDRYVLSQSQMKITVNPSMATAEFVYEQFRTRETSARFIAQSMSSGVPHVNLKTLRDFELITPPSPLQVRFSDHVKHLHSEAWLLREQASRLVATRAMLLPKLVTGQIDVSGSDCDPLVERVK